MKTTLIIGDDIARRAKRRAAEAGMTLSEFAERALRDALTERSPKRERIVLPTSGHNLPPYAHTVAEIKSLEYDLDR